MDLLRISQLTGLRLFPSVTTLWCGSPAGKRERGECNQQTKARLHYPLLVLHSTVGALMGWEWSAALWQGTGAGDSQSGENKWVYRAPGKGKKAKRYAGSVNRGL